MSFRWMYSGKTGKFAISQYSTPFIALWRIKKLLQEVFQPKSFDTPFVQLEAIKAIQLLQIRLFD